VTIEEAETIRKQVHAEIDDIPDDQIGNFMFCLRVFMAMDGGWRVPDNLADLKKYVETEIARERHP